MPASLYIIQSLFVSTLMLTNWVNISGTINPKSEWNTKNAKIILTSDNIFLTESILGNDGTYSIDYLVEGESKFEMKLIYNSHQDTLLLKEVEQFDSQFEVWNFNLSTK